MAKNSPVAPNPQTEKMVPAQTTVSESTEAAINAHKGPATYGGMIRFILTEWAKKNPAPRAR